MNYKCGCVRPLTQGRGGKIYKSRPGIPWPCTVSVKAHLVLHKKDGLHKLSLSCSTSVVTDAEQGSLVPDTWWLSELLPVGRMFPAWAGTWDYTCVGVSKNKCIYIYVPLPSHSPHTTHREIKTRGLKWNFNTIQPQSSKMLTSPRNKKGSLQTICHDATGIHKRRIRTGVWEKTP